MGWKDLARQAGFITADDRRKISTSQKPSGDFAGMKIVGEPTMPKGYVALVSKTEAVVIGPRGSYTVPLYPSWLRP